MKRVGNQLIRVTVTAIACVALFRSTANDLGDRRPEASGGVLDADAHAGYKNDTPLVWRLQVMAPMGGTA
ncbi:MAG: hypothetical protein EPN74_01945 [Rhodanobacter sp.]|nr:MAG: hypothetical protein EPN74_01945 [Rhodanobacter sp.]